MLRILARLTLLAGLGLAAVVAWLGWEYHRYLSQPVVPAGAPVSFEIRKGEAGQMLAQTLRSAGVGVSDWRLALVWRLRGDSGQIKAGEYAFQGPTTLAALLDELIAGQPQRDQVLVLVEGQTFAQYRAVLAQAPGLVRASADMSERQILDQIGVASASAEGWFAPDSYRYSEGSTDLHLLARAYQLQRARLAEAWASRSDRTPVTTPEELLTLASIIEKETGQDSERALVAAVFANRLRLGMLLQSDPTTIYGMGERFDGNLRRRDLRADTPYNTYKRPGLPPTAIAMPGRAALAAAAQPSQSRALYFVARGDGTSHFSDDLVSHNRAVERYQRRRAEATGTAAAHGVAESSPSTSAGAAAPR